MSADHPTGPRISVVLSTYQRSNVLRIAIETVLRQSAEDWELLVVGDGCTDDSAEVVANVAAGDPRVRWVNLAVNTGDQSGPNNEGIRLARGRHVALLNHDDLWFPDHLERSTSALEETGADLVFTIAAAHTQTRLTALGVAPSGRYDLFTYALASTLVFRRETADAIGPWAGARGSRVVPSQHWLARAHALGLDLRAVPAVTVVHHSSTSERDSYALRRSAAQEATLARMVEDPVRFRADLVTELLIAHAHEVRPHTVRQNVRSLAKDALYRASARLAIHPQEASAAIRLQPRGGWLRHTSAIRGTSEIGSHP